MKLGATIIAAFTALSMMAVSVSAADYEDYDSTSYGYGMGRDVDSGGRPYGADNFNADYGGVGAYAIFEPGSGVTLTFDEGYENGYTSIILDALRDKGVKAIFFVTGDYVRSNKPLIQRMIDEGHIIGNHGMKHKSIPGLSHEGLVEDIMSLHELVKSEFNYEMVFYRPPCGEFSERSLKQVQDLGYTTLMWSFAYVDWEENNQPAPDAAFERITSAAHEGEIMLLHAVSSVNASLMPQIIDNFREQGLEFVLPVVQYVN
ncbi:MAG: polysaccharide deacetylase family protein [Ruminococcus sp.]|jgi:peptidoglycan-N-acetylmuramic acid deacetylase|nr:polysaccharide deacetylase family protein [Ruminococcus sp.]